MCGRPSRCRMCLSLDEHRSDASIHVFGLFVEHLMQAAASIDRMWFMRLVQPRGFETCGGADKSGVRWAAMPPHPCPSQVKLKGRLGTVRCRSHLTEIGFVGQALRNPPDVSSRIAYSTLAVAIWHISDCHDLRRPGIDRFRHRGLGVRHI